MLRTPVSMSLAVFLVVAACSQAPPPPPDTSEADAATLRAANDQWIASFNAGDVEALGQSYTEDAIEISPDRPPSVGRAAIVQSLTDFLSEFSVTQSSTVDEVTVFGDVAMVRGIWNVHQTPKAGGAEQVRSGRWMLLDKRQPDGSWKTWRWMWNQKPEDAAGL